MRQWSSFKNLPNIDFLGAVIILELKEVAGAYGGRSWTRSCAAKNAEETGAAK
jgi:hypothetical protein